MRTSRVGWLMLVGMLVLPRPAHAGFWDIIWEMTGPQMVGLRVFEFERGLSRAKSGPRAGTFGKVVILGPVRLGTIGQNDTDAHWLWLTTEFNLYRSTAYRADELNLGPVWMLGLDPMIALGRRFENGVRLHTGAGVSLNHAFGPDIKPVSNYAFKFRPASLDYRFGNGVTIGVALNLRLYPNEYVVGMNPPSLTTGDKSELTRGFVIDFSF